MVTFWADQHHQQIKAALVNQRRDVLEKEDKDKRKRIRTVSALPLLVASSGAGAHTNASKPGGEIYKGHRIPQLHEVHCSEWRLRG